MSRPLIAIIVIVFVAALTAAIYDHATCEAWALDPSGATDCTTYVPRGGGFGYTSCEPRKVCIERRRHER